jgi:PAS domain S-box-containing protein
MPISESQRLESLYKIARALHEGDLHVRSMLQTVLSMTGQAIGAGHGCVLTFKPDGSIGDAYILGGTSDEAGERRLWDTLIRRGLIGFVYHGQRTIIIRDLKIDPRWPHIEDPALIPDRGSAIGLPLTRRDELHGVMILLHDEIDYFDPPVVEMLEAIANIASAALGNALAFLHTRASKARYQWLFHDSIVPIILTDLNGDIVDANLQAYEFLDYNRDQMTGLSITAVHRMGTGPLGSSRFASLQQGQEIEFRATAWTASARQVPVIVRARRLSFEDQDLIEWVEQDISAQLELEQLRADLSAMVYHDLRGPLQAINTSLATLRRLLAGADDEMVRDLIEIAGRSTRQLARMVESLLDIQRLEAGQAVLDSKTTSLYHLLATAIQLVEPLAAEAEQTLRLDINDDMPALSLDSDMILRVITNLIENAVKYTPSSGTIHIGATQVDDTIHISVADSGPGIPTTMQRHIFDKFSRIRHTDAPKGIGLGLAFCRLAVEAHGGRIWVESEPGQGSTFIFALPLTQQPEPRAV